MKKRIIKQKDDYSCGPTAIYNALILFGKQPPALSKLKRYCKTNPNGTYEDDFVKTATKFFLIENYSEKPTKAFHRLKKGAVFLFGFSASEHFGHYTVLYMKNNKLITINNHEDNVLATKPCNKLKLVHKISKTWLKNKLKQSDLELYEVLCAIE